MSEPENVTRADDRAQDDEDRRRDDSSGVPTMRM